jgi:hypothetical protein
MTLFVIPMPVAAFALALFLVVAVVLPFALDLTIPSPELFLVFTVVAGIVVTTIPMFTPAALAAFVPYLGQRTRGCSSTPLRLKRVGFASWS